MGKRATARDAAKTRSKAAASSCNAQKPKLKALKKVSNKGGKKDSARRADSSAKARKRETPRPTARPVATAARCSEVASPGDRVMESFEKHLDAEYTESTCIQYRNAIKRLFKKDGKSLHTITSEGYEQVLRRQRKPFILRASVKAFKAFFAKRGGSVANSPVRSRKPGKPAIFSVKGGEEEASRIAQELKPFIEHLIAEKGSLTARTYGTAVRSLIRWHRKSLDAMASKQYVERVLKSDLDYKYSAAARAFYQFRSGEKLGPRGLEAQEARKRKSSKMASNKDGKNNSSVEMQELQSFLDHLDREKGQGTAKQYGFALQKLIRLHGKSLDDMATQAYVDKVRKLDWQRKYAASVMALSRFRGAEFAARRADASGKAGKQESQKKDGKKDVSKARTRGRTESGDAVPKKDGKREPGGLQAFLDHLLVEKLRGTAIVYGRAIRKLGRLHRKSLDFMASEEYLNRVRKMNWPFVYASAVQALCRFRGSVAMGWGDQRRQANAEAQRRLATARSSGRPVSDGDILTVLRLWPFAKNINRLAVMPKGTTWVHSATVGILSDRTGRTIISNATDGSEDLVRLLCQWLEHQLGVGFGADAFPVTSININKGYAAARHRDKGNQGPSAIRALGSFQDGMLRYWPDAAADADLDGLRDEDSLLLDPRHELVLFDGNRPHAVTPFQGERYSVVFFTSSRHPRATADTRAEARKLGLRWPTNQLLTSAKARVAQR